MTSPVVLTFRYIALSDLYGVYSVHVVPSLSKEELRNEEWLVVPSFLVPGRGQRIHPVVWKMYQEKYGHLRRTSTGGFNYNVITASDCWVVHEDPYSHRQTYRGHRFKTVPGNEFLRRPCGGKFASMM